MKYCLFKIRGWQSTVSNLCPYIKFYWNTVCSFVYVLSWLLLCFNDRAKQQWQKSYSKKYFKYYQSQKYLQSSPLQKMFANLCWRQFATLDVPPTEILIRLVCSGCWCPKPRYSDVIGLKWVPTLHFQAPRWFWHAYRFVNP